MKNEFVTYDLALRMKELGYNEPCFGYYEHNTKELDTISSEVCERLCKHTTHIKAPTYQSAFAWFRDKCGLHSYLSPKLSYPDDYITGEYYINILCNKFDYDVDGDGVYLYEEAQEACLEKLCEIVEKN